MKGSKKYSFLSPNKFKIIFAVVLFLINILYFLGNQNYEVLGKYFPWLDLLILLLDFPLIMFVLGLGFFYVPYTENFNPALFIGYGSPNLGAIITSSILTIVYCYLLACLVYLIYKSIKK